MSQIGFYQNDEVPRNLTIDKLIENMMKMQDDPLANAGTNVVICRGNPHAKLMIVGEAPGPQENIQGKPFVGKAGKLLDQILTAVELDPENDVFITNSVFRMPPGDGGKTFRKPNVDEIEYYKPYVLEIIRLSDPRIVLLAGNVACQSILGKSGITKLRGHWMEIQNRWVMPIFHPSYLLRNPSREPGSPKSLMWDDIREVRKKYNQIATH
jgi:uracil-DNA glycosylase family 4